MLETEADLLRTLRSGAYTLDELYALCETAVDVSRDNGRSPVNGARHRTDSVWKHRVRGWLANAKAKGLAERVDRATWLIQGTAENPSRLVLLNAGGELAGVEMRVQDAVELLHSIEEPDRAWSSATRRTRSLGAAATSPTATGTGRSEQGARRLRRRRPLRLRRVLLPVDQRRRRHPS